MAEGKKKFIDDAVRVIEGRVEDLEKKLIAAVARDPNSPSHGPDRAAIAEARHCARLISTLALAPYHSDPYQIAQKRWSKGSKT